jgi:hypothetical protein
MIDWLISFALGFLTASLFALPLVSLVHARATRLAARRLMVDIPISMAEIYADRDALRAEFAVTAHRLERRIEVLTAKLAEQGAALGRKTDELNRLKFALARRSANRPPLELGNRQQGKGQAEEPSPGVAGMAPAARSLHQSLAELAERNPDLAQSPFRTLVAEAAE